MGIFDGGNKPPGTRAPLPPGGSIRSSSRAGQRYSTVVPMDDYFKGLQQYGNLPGTVNVAPSQDAMLGTDGQMVPIAFLGNYPVLPMTFQLIPPGIGIDVEPVRQRTEDFFTRAGIADARVRLAEKLGDRYQGQNNLNQAASKNVAIATSGRRFNSQESWLTQIDDVRKAEKAMSQLPALTLLINPSEMNRSFTKKLQSEITVNGWKTEHYGEELDKLSASGRTGGFYTAEHGLTRFFRRNSAAFQNLMQLWMIYKNNGRLYHAKYQNRIDKVGAVSIQYDGDIYIGSFDSFNLKEDSEKPFSMEYDFEFTVRLFIPGTVETKIPVRKYVTYPVDNKNAARRSEASLNRNEEGIPKADQTYMATSLAAAQASMVTATAAEQAVDQQQVERGAGALAIGNTVALTQEALNSMLGIEEEG